MRYKNISLNSKLNIESDQHIAGRSKNCSEVKTRLGGSAPDGEYEMEVGEGEREGRLIMVYCHLMNTSRPREYITLPASQMMENYSHIFSRRLIQPNVCSQSDNHGPRTLRCQIKVSQVHYFSLPTSQ